MEQSLAGQTVERIARSGEGGAGETGVAPGRTHRLESVVWEEIVPRLAYLHHTIRAIATAVPPTTEEIEEFGGLVIAGDGAAATAFFQRICARGHSFDSLFEILLAPTARHLGVLWEDDRCDFLEVTLGVGRLQELLDAFGSAAGAEIRSVERRALLIAVPEEQHIFGLKMVSKFLMSAGWDVRIHDRIALQNNVAAVANEWIGVVGLTMGTPRGLDAVTRAISAIRRASVNRSIAVIVGGEAFANAPEHVARVGADACAADGPTAVVLARRLLMRQIAAPSGSRSQERVPAQAT